MGFTYAMCGSYSTILDECTDVQDEEIAENWSMCNAVGSDGLRACFDDVSKIIWVVDDECDLQDTSVMSTLLLLDGTTNQLCERNSIMENQGTDNFLKDP